MVKDSKKQAKKNDRTFRLHEPTRMPSMAGAGDMSPAKSQKTQSPGMAMQLQQAPAKSGVPPQYDPTQTMPHLEKAKLQPTAAKSSVPNEQQPGPAQTTMTPTTPGGQHPAGRRLTCAV